MKNSLTIISLLFTVALLALTTGCGKMIKKSEVTFSPDTNWVYDTNVVRVKPAPVLEEKFADVVAPVYFDYDSYDLSPASVETLKKIAEFLEKEKNTAVNVKVEGHTDERGTHGYNQALGQKRANAVKNYFKSYGISKKRLSAVSFGELKPVSKGTSESDYEQNRRGEMIEK